MSERWELVFTALPPSPNDRMNRWARADSNADWRELAGWVAKKKQIPPQEHIRLSAVIRRRNIGVSDADNDAARFKPVQDGLKDAGIVPDDTRQYVEWGEIREERGPRGFTLIIEALEPMPPAPGAAREESGR